MPAKTEPHHSDLNPWALPLKPRDGRSNVAEDLRGGGGVLVTPAFCQLIRGILQIQRKCCARKQGNSEGRHAMARQTRRYGTDPAIHPEHLRKHDIHTI